MQMSCTDFIKSKEKVMLKLKLGGVLLDTSVICFGKRSVVTRDYR